MSGRRDLWFIFLLALVAYGWSLFYPIADAHAFRQTWTASTVRLFAREGIDLLRPRVDLGELTGPASVVHEIPIYQAIVAVLYRVLGEREALGRLVSALCGLAAAAILYLAVRQVAAREAGLLSALAALASPVNVLYGRAFLIDPMNVALCVLFFWLSLRILLDPRDRLREAAALAVIGPLAAAMKGIFLLPFLGGLAGVAASRLLRDRRPDARWLGAASAWLAVPVATTLLAAATWRLHADRINIEHGRPGDAISLLPAWYFFRSDQIVDPPTIGLLALRVALTLGPAGLLLVPPGARAATRRLREPWGAMTVGLAAGSILYLILFLNLNVRHQYYHLPLAYALAPMIAAPLAAPRPGGPIGRVARRPGAILLGFASSALAGVLVVAHVRTSVTRVGFPYDRDLVAVGREFRSVVPEGRPPTLFVVPSPLPHEPHEILYFADTKGVVAPTIDAAPLDEMAARGIRFVAVERGAGTDADARAVTEYPGAREVGRTARLAVFEIPPPRSPPES